MPSLLIFTAGIIIMLALPMVLVFKFRKNINRFRGLKYLLRFNDNYGLVHTDTVRQAIVDIMRSEGAAVTHELAQYCQYQPLSPQAFDRIIELTFVLDPLSKRNGRQGSGTQLAIMVRDQSQPARQRSFSFPVTSQGLVNYAICAKQIVDYLANGSGKD